MEADDATEQADDIAPDPEVEALRAQEASDACNSACKCVARLKRQSWRWNPAGRECYN